MSRLALTDEEFDALRTLLSKAAGLVFDQARRDSMAYSVAERLRCTGVPSVRAYLGRLDDPTERQALLDEVTIQETHFFRNPPQIRALRQSVLPELIREAETRGIRRLRVWSAGCSTGEEPYTIAMLLRELIPAKAGWDVKVLATDVSQRALAAARVGRYGARAVQMADPEDLSRWFLLNAEHAAYEVREEVRELVEFRHHNLVTDPIPAQPGDFDLVLCRNVTIYFGRETTRDLVGRFHTSLREGGYLFLGHSETLWQVSEEFRLVALGAGDSAAFVYRQQPPDRQPDRRTVLPDRRTSDDGPPLLGPERRLGSRRGPRPVEERRRSRLVTQPAPTRDLGGEARTALAEGRYDDAARLATEAALQNPMDARAHYLRGAALADLGRDTEALVALRKAVYLSPEDGFAHFQLASALGRLGDVPAARREYAAAAETLGRRPEDALAPELGGRSVHELAELCRRLSEEEAS
jgi:chemotaxis protein methyltransferase CheR